MQKIKITATIPVVQYGNIMPEFEVEAETYEEAQAIALSRIEGLWKIYAEPDKQLARGGRTKLYALIGGIIYLDEVTHHYVNEAGEVYLSGSRYARQFEEPFDQALIANKMAAKYGVAAEDIIKMWELKANISTQLGKALHAAMEMHGRYSGLALKMERSASHDNPMVLEAVRQFYAVHKEDAHYEALVVDHAAKRVGIIDRLAKTEHGLLIEDFKTDVNIQKKLPIYRKQLSFYAAILKAAGCTVAGLAVYHWDGSKWTTYKLEVEKI